MAAGKQVWQLIFRNSFLRRTSINDINVCDYQVQLTQKHFDFLLLFVSESPCKPVSHHVKNIDCMANGWTSEPFMKWAKCQGQLCTCFCPLNYCADKDRNQTILTHFVWIIWRHKTSPQQIVAELPGKIGSRNRRYNREPSQTCFRLDQIGKQAQRNNMSFAFLLMLDARNSVK